MASSRNSVSKVLSWQLAIAAAPAICGELLAQSTLQEHYGTAGLGISVAACGDLDGDGIPDYCAGSNGGTPRITAYSGATGSIFFEVSVPPPNQSFAFSIDAGADVNVDGVPDILASSCLSTPGTAGAMSTAGSIHLFSGLNGAKLTSQNAPMPHGNDLFGWHAAFVGDTNGDGVEDYAASSGTTNYVENPPFLPAVHVFSGASWTWLYTMTSPYLFDDFGLTFCAIPDIDFDGREDIAIGAPNTYANLSLAAGPGRIAIYSGASGQFRKSIVGAPEDLIGRSLAAIGDLDGDGLTEIATGAIVPSGHGIKIFSYGTHASLETFVGSSQYYWGDRLAVIEDVDGKGASDLLVSAGIPTSSSPVPAGLAVISTETLDVLFLKPQAIVDGPPFPSSSLNYPNSLAAIGSIDRDKHSEWLVGDPYIVHPSSIVNGYLEVVTRSPFVAQKAQVSPLLFESALLELNAGVKCAGQPYLVLASYSGTSGIPIGQQALPLTYDYLTDITIQFPNTFTFQNTAGLLDAATGRAVALFASSGVPPIANGLTLWFAYVALQPGGYFVSNAVSVKIQF